MARFLSDAWFDELAGAAEVPAAPSAVGPREQTGTQGPAPELVVEVIASGAPEGEVRYQIVLEGHGPRVLSHRESFRPAQVELRADYATLASIASGEMLAIDAMSAGLARVSGNISALSARQSRVGGLDLLPPLVRANTTF